jgi:gluconate 2-dehydrogenase gamma chain
MNQTRRHWLSTCVAMAAWPAVVAAQQHANISANVAAQSPTKSFETLDAESAEEIEAIAAQIIPSTDDPGAREAGVIYFIDRALSTFARDEREAYRKGMAEIQRKRQELFPTSRSVASLISERQMILIRAVEESDF